MNADDKHSVVKSKLSSLSGIPANNLKLAEIIGAQIKVSHIINYWLYFKSKMNNFFKHISH